MNNYKDSGIDNRLYSSGNKGNIVDKISKLDQTIAAALDQRLDASNVLQFPISKPKKALKSKADKLKTDLANGVADEEIDMTAPLSKTLNIQGLAGNRRKVFGSKETDITETNGDGTSEYRGQVTESNSKEVEPPYFKVYLDTVAAVSGMNGGVKSFILELGRFMTYEGTIQVTKRTKEKVAKALGVSEGTVANYLTKATKTGVLVSNGGGEYLFHPSVMGRGSWKDVKKNRTDLYNHAVGIIRLEHKDNGETEQKFQFLDLETAKAVMLVMGAEEEVLDRVIKAHRTNQQKA